MAAAAAATMMVVPGAAVGSAAAGEPGFECSDTGICLYDLRDGQGASFEVPLAWEGGYLLEWDGWDNKATSIRNEDSLVIRLIDGEYHACTVVDTIQPGEARNLVAGADNKVDLVDNTYPQQVC